MRKPGVFLVMAIVAAVFTQLPSAGAQQTSAANAAPASGDAVIVWSANAGVAATKACIAPLDDPFHESRIYSMMHVAIHDALNAIDRRFLPYTFDGQAEPIASPDAAVAAAARDVLVPLLGQLPRELVSQSCIDAGVASVEAAYTVALAAFPMLRQRRWSSIDPNRFKDFWRNADGPCATSSERPRVRRSSTLIVHDRAQGALRCVDGDDRFSQVAKAQALVLHCGCV
jgi:hypothetical protein